MTNVKTILENIKQLETDVKVLGEKVEILEKDNVECKNSNDALKGENEKFKEIIRQLKIANSELKKKNMEEMTRKLQLTLTDCINAEDEKFYQTLDFNDTDKIIKEKSRIIENLEIDIVRLKDENRKIQINVDELGELVKKLRAENADIQNEKNQTLENVNKLRKECELKQSAIELIKTKLESKNAEAIVEANELHKALQVEKDKCQQLTDLYNSHKEKCNNYETKIRNLEEWLHKMNRQNFQQRQQENVHAQFGDNRAVYFSIPPDDKEPEWWNRHKRQGAIGCGINAMSVCPNCNTGQTYLINTYALDE